MAKFVGLHGDEIKLVSDQKFSHKDLQIIELPTELQNLDANELIANFKIRNGQLSSKFSKKPISQIKLAFIGNWKMKCGIATYSENLWSEVIKHVGDFHLFIEEQESYTSPINVINEKEYPTDKVIPCWKRGQSLQQLISEIKKYNPDIIWIQHEFGLWSNAGYWLSMLTQLSDYRIIVTMHSIFHHKDKTIVEAAIPEIVVHLDGAKKVLKEEKQIPGKVHIIPHGCFPCTDKNKLWNFYKTNHTVIQAGFLFRYKGWEESLKSIGILKNKYPDIFFTGLCSESDYNKANHQLYYKELMELIDKLNIKENVALIRGYQSDQSWDSYFRTNQVALFPYVSEPGHEVFGASGAARIAMTKALPVITSSANHFNDLPTIKADSPEEIAAALDKCFTDSKFKQDQINKQISFLNDNSWEKIASKYISIFENPELIMEN